MLLIYKKYLKYIAVPMLLFGVVFSIGFYKLTESPPTWYDEGILIQCAKNIVERGMQEIQIAPGEFVSTGFISTGYPLFYPLALFFKFLGVNLFSARLMMIFFLLFFTAIFYQLVKNLFGYRYAIISIFLLIGFPPLYGNGKNVLGEVPGLFFLALFFLCLIKSERNQHKNIFYLAAAALFAGLSVATKSIFIILAPAIFLGALIFRKEKLSLRTIFWFCFFFALPIIFWLLTQFGGGDVARGMLQIYANPYDIPAAAMKNTIVLNLLRFFTEATPVYFFAFFAIWAARLVIVFKKDRRSISLAEGISFIFVLLMLLAYLRTPGWYRYFFIGHVLTFIYAPYSLFYLAENTGKDVCRRILKIVACLILLVIISFQFYKIMFGSWTANYYSSAKTEVLQNYFSNFPPQGKSIFVYNVPEIITFLKTDNYFQYLRVAPQMIRGENQLPKIDRGVPDYIIMNGNEDYSKFKLYKEKEAVANYIILEKNN